MSDDLQKRVEQFRCLELPGQPMIMHIGTSLLVSALWKEVQRLRALPSAEPEPTAYVVHSPVGDALEFEPPCDATDCTTLHKLSGPKGGGEG